MSAAYLARVVSETTVEDLPRLIGDLEAAKAQAWARLSAPAQPRTEREPNSRLLDQREAAGLAGTSVRWLLRHTRGLRFRRDLSRKQVRFEEAGLRRWLASRA